jgi:hypothetical protein
MSREKGKGFFLFHFKDLREIQKEIGMNFKENLRGNSKEILEEVATNLCTPNSNKTQTRT